MTVPDGLPHDWTNLQAEGGTMWLDEGELGYMTAQPTQVAALRALADIRREISDLPEEESVLGVVFGVVLQKGETQARTTSYLWGPRRVLVQLLEQLGKVAQP